MPQWISRAFRSASTPNQLMEIVVEHEQNIDPEGVVQTWVTLLPRCTAGS
jgi:hypothetical protein